MNYRDRVDLLGMAVVAVVIAGLAFSTSCEIETGEERAWSDEPRIEVKCRNGYAVPRGHSSHLSYSNGIACAVHTTHTMRREAYARKTRTA